ncbi:outer membrane protein [Gynuella sunshinyii YC6258]|uniref:Outer membrane protein n=2 Tax=Gynuella sunshinyii TaxID=1445505 RepID=A0A0C5VE96_9GAMM|nr:TolC family protein [Gynuella sunshinyii]AJQ92536.1 outer membrane protein [Gynuella sunshinyii YC6258]
MGLLLCVLSGCSTMTPKYQLDAFSPDDNWHSETGQISDRQATEDMTGWWRKFDDELLNQLVQLTLANNTDLKTAQLNYQLARLDQKYAKVDGVPSVSATASASESISHSSSSESFSDGLSASWELDLWGNLASAQKSADASVAASLETLHYSQVSLIAETASSYAELRSAQENLRVIRANIAIQEQSYDFVKWQKEAGISTDLEVIQAETTLEQTRASLPEYENTVNQAMNRLWVLTGGLSDGLSRQLREYVALPAMPASMALGIPADTLRQRPDVKAKEFAVKVQAENVVQAGNQRYPSFNLTGSLTGGGTRVSDLFDLDSFITRLATSLSYSLFDGGTVKKNMQSQQLQLQQSLLDYRAALLSAREEVENALGTLSSKQHKQKALQLAEDSASLALDLANVRYEAGLIDFETVLDAQSTLLTAQNELATNRGDILSAWIELYRSLGGGWQGLTSTTDGLDA